MAVRFLENSAPTKNQVSFYTLTVHRHLPLFSSATLRILERGWKEWIVPELVIWAIIIAKSASFE